MGAAAQVQVTQNAISLRGSTQIVTEFFGYAVNRYGLAQQTDLTHLMLAQP
jgi:hypothetical protein